MTDDTYRFAHFDAQQRKIEQMVPTSIASLIAAEQARARRLHPDDHAGHPDNDNYDHFNILADEITEVHAELNWTGINMIWELIQVAGIAAAWAERALKDGGYTADDLLDTITEGTPE